MLVLNRISVNDSLPLPLCRALVDYCIQKNMIILHRFSSSLEEGGDYVCNLWTQVSKAQRIISLICVIALFNYPNVFFIPDSSAMLFFCVSAVGDARMAGCESYSIKLWMELLYLERFTAAVWSNPKTYIFVTLHLLTKLNLKKKKKLYYECHTSNYFKQMSLF